MVVKNVRILITGGAGFIGSHICALAIEEGHEVAALDNLSSGRRENIPPGVELYEADIRDSAATLSAFKDFRPDTVSHQAAQVSVSASMRDPAADASTNIVGSIHVANAARATGCERLVFASTGGAIYGNIAHGQADEQWATAPESPYAIHKLAFEQHLKVYRSQNAFLTTTLRYANVFGPRQDPHGEAGVVAIFYERLLAGREIQVNGMLSKGDDGCIRDYVFVRDVAKANLAALQGLLKHDLLNVATGVATDTRTLANRIVESLDKANAKLVDGQPRNGDVARSLLDPSRCVANFGPATPLKIGLDETRAWFQAQ